MVATVGTAMMASSSAGRIVHPISSRVLPWICFGFSFLPGAVAELHRQHDGGDDDRDADDDRDDQDRDEEVVDLLRLRDPWAASEFCPLFLTSEHPARTSTTAATAARTSRRPRERRGVMSPSESGRAGVPRAPVACPIGEPHPGASALYMGELPVQQLLRPTSGKAPARPRSPRPGRRGHGGCWPRTFAAKPAIASVEDRAGPEVAGERGGVAGAGVGPGQGPGAECPVVRELAQVHPGQVALALHVPQLAHVVLVTAAGRLAPAEEDVARGLGEPLAGDDPAALVTEAVDAPTYGASTDGCASFTWSTIRSSAAVRRSPRSRHTQHRVPTLPTPTTRRATSTTRKRSRRKRRSSVSDGAVVVDHLGDVVHVVAGRVEVHDDRRVLDEAGTAVGVGREPGDRPEVVLAQRAGRRRAAPGRGTASGSARRGRRRWCGRTRRRGSAWPRTGAMYSR